MAGRASTACAPRKPTRGRGLAARGNWRAWRERRSMRASGLFLQVEADNAAAIALYRAPASSPPGATVTGGGARRLKTAPRMPLVPIVPDLASRHCPYPSTIHPRNRPERPSTPRRRGTGIRQQHLRALRARAAIRSARAAAGHEAVDHIKVEDGLSRRWDVLTGWCLAHAHLSQGRRRVERLGAADGCGRPSAQRTPGSIRSRPDVMPPASSICPVRRRRPAAQSHAGRGHALHRLAMPQAAACARATALGIGAGCVLRTRWRRRH